MTRKGFSTWIAVLLLLLVGGISLLITGIQIDRERPLVREPRIKIEATHGEGNGDAAA